MMMLRLLVLVLLFLLILLLLPLLLDIPQQVLPFAPDTPTATNTVELLLAQVLVVEQQIPSGAPFRHQHRPRRGGRVVQHRELCPRVAVCQQSRLEAPAPRKPLVVARFPSFLTRHIAGSGTRVVRIRSLMGALITEQEVVTLASWEYHLRVRRR